MSLSDHRDPHGNCPRRRAARMAGARRDRGDREGDLREHWERLGCVVVHACWFVRAVRSFGYDWGRA